MKKRSLMLFTVLFLLIFASYCYADTFYVTTSDDFRTALDSADENGESDTITLEAGTYVASPDAFQYDENDSEEGYSITIIGSGDVILDGGGASQVLNCYSSYLTDITLQNLTIQSGDANGHGGGAYIWIQEGNINVVECSFKDNESTNDYGGGLYAWIDACGSTINILSCDFTGNSASGLNGEGGGLYAWIDDDGYITEYYDYDGNTINISGCDFTDNSTSGSGGGLNAEAYGDINVENTSFSGNSCTDDGGGAYIYPYGEINLTNCTFTNNTTTASVSEEEGEGVGGGGAYLYPCYDECMVTGNKFSGNSASTGGGIYLNVYEVTSITLTNNLVADNNVDYKGGGVYFVSRYVDTADIINNTITGNNVLLDTSFSYGGGLFVRCLYPDTDVSIYNNIIWGNTSYHYTDLPISEPDDIYLTDEDGPPDHNGYKNYFDLYNNLYSTLASSFFYGESVLSSGSNYNTSDPHFFSDTDYHLQEGSIAIDRGDNLAPSLPVTDMDGNARIYGGTVDMGAYEYDSIPTGDDEDDDDEDGNGGGGGNCNIGAFVPSMLLLIAPLLFLVRKR